MLALRALIAGVALAVFTRAQQIAFDLRGGDSAIADVAHRAPTNYGFSTTGNMTLETRALASVTSQDEFVALTHPRFPAHQVRVKKTPFCDPTVKCVRAVC